MSFPDQCQDLTNEYLIKLVTQKKRLKDQMTIMREIEKRDFMDDEKFYELLEKCNGI